MNKKIISLGSVLMCVFLFGAQGASALSLNLDAQSTAGANTSSNGDAMHATVTADMGVHATTSPARIAKNKARAEREIDQRVTALTKLETRIAAMKRLSSDQKTSLTATLSAQVSAMSDLKSKIDADTDTTVLKTDIQSITKAYRIFALVLPLERIVESADTLATRSDTMTTLSAKLQVRIDAAHTAGKDTTVVAGLISDMNTNSADAKVQANAAVALIVNLKPDNGDKSIAKSNTQAIFSARAKIKVGEMDIRTARRDASKITSALRAMHLNASMNAGVTASSTTTVR